MKSQNPFSNFTPEQFKQAIRRGVCKGEIIVVIAPHSAGKMIQFLLRNRATPQQIRDALSLEELETFWMRGSTR